jgi:hypothetical protein
MDELSTILVNVQNSNTTIRQQAEHTLHELILSSADNSLVLYASFSSDISRAIHLRHLCNYIFIISIFYSHYITKYNIIFNNSFLLIHIQ